MKLTKVDKALQIVLKNPGISNADLARKVNVPVSNGWTLRMGVEKKMAKEKIKKPHDRIPVETQRVSPKSTIKVPDTIPSAPALTAALSMHTEGEYLVIRLPRKSLSSLLLRDVLDSLS